MSGANWYLLGIGGNATLRLNGRNVTIGSVLSSGAPQLPQNWFDADGSPASYEVYPDLDAYTFSAGAKQFSAMATQMQAAGRLVVTADMPLSPDCYTGLTLKGQGTNTPPASYDAYVVGSAPMGGLGRKCR